MNIYLSGDFMLNYIWSGMIVIAVLVSFFNGTTADVCLAFGEGASEGVSLAISMAGIMALWTGIMRIAERGGIVRLMAKLIRPLTTFLFPETKEDIKAGGSIAMNMTANFFGMGNAATPMGIDAMKKLSKYSKDGGATNSMCMLAVVNSASIQLIPSTLIAIRSACSSSAPSEITVPIWIVSLATFVSAVTLCKVMQKHAPKMGSDTMGRRQ